MATDDERRDVAERLRAYGKEFRDPTWRDLCNVIFGGDDRFPTTVRKLHLVDRLADLIEPAPTRSDTAPTFDPTERGIDSIYDWCFSGLECADGAEDHLYCSIMSAIEEYRHPERVTATTARPVDREALLALADEMGHPIKQAVWFQTAGVRREHIMAEYARRIREACGEAAQ